jgi:hypothetical protein
VIQFWKYRIRRFGVGFSSSVIIMNLVVVYGVVAVVVGTVPYSIYKNLIYSRVRM